MANYILDNTYYITDSGATALTWGSGTRINTVVVLIQNTLASASFILGPNTSVFEFRPITHGAVSVGSAVSVFPSTYTFPFFGQRFSTAWIPTTLTACSAWINFY